jgi:hypothetical protein
VDLQNCKIVRLQSIMKAHSPHFCSITNIFLNLCTIWRKKIESCYSQKHCAVNRIIVVPYYESGRDVFSLLCAVNAPLLGAHQIRRNTSSSSSSSSSSSVITQSTY